MDIARVCEMQEANPLHALYRCYGTILEMLQDRGYETGEKLDVLGFFGVLKNPNYKLVYSKKADPNWNLQVFFVRQATNSDSPNLGKKDIETYKKIMEKNKVRAAVLVLMNIDVTSYARKEIETLKPTYWIECFGVNKLQINITRHEKTPRHQLLTEAETKEFLQKHSLKLDAIPKISQVDPVALYFAAQPGQVFRIDKETYVAHRVVV